jgi:hypothetical protein
MLLRAALPQGNPSAFLVRTFSTTSSLASRIRPGQPSHPHHLVPSSSKPSSSSAAFLALTDSTSAAPGGRVPNLRPAPLRFGQNVRRGREDDLFAPFNSSSASASSESPSTASQIHAAQQSLLQLSTPIQTTSYLDLPPHTSSSSSLSASSLPNLSLPLLSPPSWGLLSPSTASQDYAVEALLSSLKSSDASPSPAEYHTELLHTERWDQQPEAAATAEFETMCALRRQLALTMLTPTGDRKGVDERERQERARWAVVEEGLDGESRGRIRPSFGEQGQMDEGEKVLQMDSVKRKRRKAMAKHK